MDSLKAQRADFETAAESARLRERVARLEREKKTLEELLAGRSPSALVEVNRTLMKQLAELEEQLHRVEQENHDFASLCVQAQEQNQALASLYVASQRLHATLDPDQVMKVIMEILVELVGAEDFGVLLLDEKKKRLELVAGEGVRERLPNARWPLGDGVIGEVAVSGRPFYFQPKNPTEDEARLPRAAIPLQYGASTVGVIAIYKLLRQKAGFSSVDVQLLELLAAHAATALASARLHSAVDRKLKTMESFIQLIKS